LFHVPLLLELIKECDHSSESNYFWYRYTLNISTDITQTGPFLWWLIVSLASSWIIVYLCTIKGIKSTGKCCLLESLFWFFFPFSSRNDCEKDSVIIATVNSLTSIYASITTFSILGFKATINYRDCLDR
ncbi:Slc6a20a: Sodium-and chloride-dependent transporter XTRP3A, partial [Crotalus adamanteus]